MKNNKVIVSMFSIFMICLAMVFLTACKPEEEMVVLESVSITNKDDLTEVWIVGDTDRTVLVSLAPKNAYEKEFPVKVTSSDTNVVTVSGKTLKAVGAGSSKITVTAGEKSDNVTVNVTEPDRELEGVSITNKENLSILYVDGDSATVKIALNPEDFPTVGLDITLTTDKPEFVEVDGYKLTAVGVGKAVIMVKAGEKTDSVTVEAKALKSPVITLDSDDTVLNGLADSDVSLPLPTAKGTDGKILTSDVAITCDNENVTITNGQLRTSDPGTYTVVYSVADKRGDDLVTTKELTVNVYRKVIGDNIDGTWSMENEMVVDEEQTLVTSNTGYAIAYMNIDPGKYYYAEATFTLDITEKNGGKVVGLAHSYDDGASRWLATVIDRGDSNAKIADFDTLKGWSLQENKDHEIYYQYNIIECRGLSDPNPAQVKIATVRDGETFYLFVNDQYVMAVQMEAYADIDTVPGFFGNAINDAVISNIIYFDGDAVHTKLNEILDNGAGYIQSYCPDQGWAGDSVNTDNRNFTVNEVTEERGINFDFTSTTTHFNGGMVSPQIRLTGDFTFSWEYKMTSYDADADQPRMLLENRDIGYGGEAFEFGYDHKTGKILMNTPRFPEGSKWYEVSTDDWDMSEGIRYTFSRVVNDDHSILTMTAVSVADSTQSCTRTVTWDAPSWNTPWVMVWHNTAVAGQYSNITWSNN
jgi:hypothetical protein